MKRFLCFAPLLIAVAMLTGCAGSNDTSAGLADQSVSEDQTKAKLACYTAHRSNLPDMSTWQPEQIAQYELIQKLGDSNKLLAKVSLDPCADAGGTNVYDAKIAQVKEGTKRQKNWMDLGKDVAGKALYGTIAVFGFDWLKDTNDKGDTVIQIPEDQDPFLDDPLLGDPLTGTDVNIPEVTL